MTMPISQNSLFIWEKHGKTDGFGAGHILGKPRIEGTSLIWIKTLREASNQSRVFWLILAVSCGNLEVLYHGCCRIKIERKLLIGILETVDSWVSFWAEKNTVYPPWPGHGSN